MKEIQFKLCLYSGIHVFLYSFKTISISCSFVKIRGYVRPFLCRFGTCLIPVWYRFVSISIGIFPYVFLPQTSFLNQYCGFASFPVFLNFTNAQMPGVQLHQNGESRSSANNKLQTTNFLSIGNWKFTMCLSCNPVETKSRSSGQKIKTSTTGQRSPSRPRRAAPRTHGSGTSGNK
jgi:hypothetical protein